MVIVQLKLKDEVLFFTAELETTGDVANCRRGIIYVDHILATVKVQASNPSTVSQSQRRIRRIDALDLKKQY